MDERDAPAAGADERVGAGRLKGQRVLLVDDEPLAREALKLHLEEAGFEVRVADDGRQALALVENLCPDLLISDVLMPELDGFGLCRELRARPLFRDLPLILYSSQYLAPEDVQLAEQLGVARYLIRPDGLEALVEAVRDVLRQLPAPVDVEQLLRDLERPIPQAHQARLINQLALKVRQLETTRQELALAEAKYRQVLEAAPDAMLLVDRVGNITYLNHQAEVLLGYTREELTGCPVETLLPKELAALHCQHRQHFMASGEAFLVKQRYEHFRARHKSGALIPVAINIGKSGNGDQTLTTAIVRDMRDALHADQQIRRLNRVYQMLRQCNRVVARAASEQELLEQFVGTIVTAGRYPLAWVGYVQDELHRRVEPAAWAGESADFLRRVSFSWGAGSDASGPEGEALGEEKPRFINLEGDRLSGYRLWLAQAAQHQFRGVAAIPLVVDHRTEGVLALYTTQAHGFDPQEQPALVELAHDLAHGIVMQRREVARRVAEQELRLTSRALAASNNGILVLEARPPGFPAVYANPAFTTMTGYGQEEVLGCSSGLLFRNDQEQDGVLALKLALEQQEAASATVRCYRRDGSVFWAEIDLAPVYDTQRAVSHFVGVCTDLSERIQYEKALEYQAQHDELTKLANRNLFRDRLDQALLNAGRYQHSCALLVIDIDRFKLINDSLGHEQGDRLIGQIANRLKVAVQPEDSLARWGGDVFVLLIVGVEHQEALARLMQHLLESIAQPLRLGKQTLTLSASIGCSLYPFDAQHAEPLMSLADAAMYHVKNRGGNGFQFYNGQINLRARQRLELEVALRRALAQNQFILFYQPVLDVTGTRLLGAEALLRWQHPVRGLVGPDEFIPLAEDTGLIRQLGHWVLTEACRQYSAWMEQGLPPMQLAVNVSYQQFIAGTFVEELRLVLEALHFPAAQLELELTERVMVEPTEEVMQQFSLLNGMGVLLSIDDFGTGFSSLGYLKRYPLDALKIDRAFVRDLPDGREARAITSAIVGMARALNYTVVAEGVETVAQQRCLESLGCDRLQGFLFSEPLPPDAFYRLARRLCDLPEGRSGGAAGS